MGGTHATHLCVMKPKYFPTFIIDHQSNVARFVHVFDKHINNVVNTRLKADRDITLSATSNATLLVF